MRREALLLAVLLAMACGRVQRSARNLEPEAGAAGGEAAVVGPSGAGHGGATGAPGGAGPGGAAGDSGGAAGDSGGAAGDSGGAGGAGDICEQQRSEYAVERDRVVAEFASFPCESAPDCLSTYDPSNCADCSFLVTTAARRGLVDRLVILGQAICTGSCARKSPVTCPDVAPPECVMGRCVPGE